ncbi:hypothetical protein SKAU_G00207490 [Synaphobranchus kaupii]|uniref:Uncharacterized protein n=1 Tax=Synaphobranchus kaupii TaxID=118154 RepID=A0A9Q1F8G0_SYNKA|nr:hypothetical protein SKAU_G00207490 [Synaphobranchus kaupii]
MPHVSPLEPLLITHRVQSKILVACLSRWPVLVPKLYTAHYFYIGATMTASSRTGVYTGGPARGHRATFLPRGLLDTTCRRGPSRGVLNAARHNSRPSKGDLGAARGRLATVLPRGLLNATHYNSGLSHNIPNKS